MNTCKSYKIILASESLFSNINALLLHIKSNSFIFICVYLAVLDLLESERKRFLNKTIRAIVLTEKTDEDVRFDLFERINTGSDVLRDMEKRRGAFQGKFTDFIKEIATNSLFISVLNITDVKKKRLEDEELALRFFAYSDNYLNFTKNVQGFLDNYLIDKNAQWTKLSNNDLKQEKDAKIKEIMNVLTHTVFSLYYMCYGKIENDYGKI